MPRGKDSYQALPDYDKLTWVDHIKAGMTSDALETNKQTGTVENPRRELMRSMIEQRRQEELAAKKEKGG